MRARGPSFLAWALFFAGVVALIPALALAACVIVAQGVERLCWRIKGEIAWLNYHRRKRP